MIPIECPREGELRIVAAGRGSITNKCIDPQLVCFQPNWIQTPNDCGSVDEVTWDTMSTVTLKFDLMHNCTIMEMMIIVESISEILIGVTCPERTR